MAERDGYYFDVSAYRNSDKVRLMDHEARGVYRDVLDEIWITGFIPNEPDKVARLISTPADVVLRVWPVIHDCLIPTREDPDRFTSERMEFERRRRNRIRREKQKNGRIGGLAKAKHDASKRLANATGLPEQRHANTSLNTSIKDTLAQFARFWTEYPKKKSKQDAEKAWLKLNPDTDLADQIIGKVKIAKACDDWQREQGRYIPYPATFLNGERWTDEGVTVEPMKAKAATVVQL